MQTENSKAVAYYPPFQGEIARVAWLPFGVSFEADEAKLKDLNDCGFNVIQLRPQKQDIPNEKIQNPAQSMAYILGLIKKAKYDMKVIFFNENVHGDYPNGDSTKEYNTGDIQRLADNFNSEAYLYAWHIKDEPRWYDWHTPDKEHAAQVSVHRNLLKEYEMIRNNDSSHIIFNNLAVPRFGTETEKIGATAENAWFPDDMNYEGFLNEYEEKFSPSLWSYDVYPIEKSKEASSQNSSEYRIQDVRTVHSMSFYKSLLIFRSRFERSDSKIPFWAYCRPYYSRYEDSQTVYPVPKYSELIWEAFSALAYGAQGIVYFCYGSHLNPSDNSTGSGVDYNDVQCVDRNGIRIDQAYVEKHTDETTNKGDDKLEPIWSYVRETNRMIAHYQQVFAGCKAPTVVHALKEDTPAATLKEYDDTLGLFKKQIGCVKKVVPHGDGVLVSQIDNNGKNYMVFVNHSPYLEQEVDVYMDTDRYSFKEYPMPAFEENRQDTTLCHSTPEDSTPCEFPQIPITSVPQMSKNLIGGDIIFGQNKTVDKASPLHMNFILGGGGFRIFEFW